MTLEPLWWGAVAALRLLGFAGTFGLAAGAGWCVWRAWRRLCRTRLGWRVRTWRATGRVTFRWHDRR